MLKFYVGDVNPDLEVHIDVAEVWSAMLPKQLVEAFDQYYTGHFDDDAHIYIRVYTDTLINFVGEQIENNVYDANQVVVFTEHGEHYFDENGALGRNWPHGLFNY